MSLRTDFMGSLNAALAAARTAGNNFIINNIADITSTLQAAADKGESTVTYTKEAAFQPSDLRLAGALWEAHVTGIEEQLASEDIYRNEVSVALNTLDATTLKIDIKFTF